MQQEPATPRPDGVLSRLRDWYLDPHTKPWMLYLWAGGSVMLTAFAITKPDTGRTWEAVLFAAGTLMSWNNLRRGR